MVLVKRKLAGIAIGLSMVTVMGAGEAIAVSGGARG